MDDETMRARLFDRFGDGNLDERVSEEGPDRGGG